MKVVTFGEIMLRLAPEGYLRFTQADKFGVVYGGGERFDETNKRGKNISLYISDSYDAKGYSGSYVAIPLFSTSRGGGMFINRYETMSISFPEKDVARDLK